MQTYIEPTHEAGRALFMRGIKGPLVMLNLLRFRQVADYSATPHWRRTHQLAALTLSSFTSPIHCPFSRKGNFCYRV
jgi:hypothetical protein